VPPSEDWVGVATGSVEDAVVGSANSRALQPSVRPMMSAAKRAERPLFRRRVSQCQYQRHRRVVGTFGDQHSAGVVGLPRGTGEATKTWQASAQQRSARDSTLQAIRVSPRTQPCASWHTPAFDRLPIHRPYHPERPGRRDREELAVDFGVRSPTSPNSGIRPGR
jgi:hypothetical protein